MEKKCHELELEDQELELKHHELLMEQEELEDLGYLLPRDPLTPVCHHPAEISRRA